MTPEASHIQVTNGCTRTYVKNKVNLCSIVLLNPTLYKILVVQNP